MLVNYSPSALMSESVAVIRDKNTNPVKFRRHLRKIGRYLAYEASKSLDTDSITIDTPLEKTDVAVIADDIVVISVLRAALPMVDAIFEEFEDASLGVASASRGEMIDENGTDFEIESDYMKIPNLGDKLAIIVDPMLATASTVTFILKQILKDEPKKVILLSAIGSEFGIKRIERQFPQVEIYCAAVDPQLNSKGYIVPGLGDAGDRACNTPH